MPPSRNAQQTLSSVNLTFLGTASAQPSSTRNHSALALRLDSEVWLFDCGEATQHQVQKSGVKMGRIRKIFITHTHGDHIFGLGPLLASCLNGAGGTADGVEDDRLQTAAEDSEPLEIYGPLGTRAYIRASLTYTRTVLAGRYVVHELRFPDDPEDGDYTALPPHQGEASAGRNIAQQDGVWRTVYADTRVAVSAAPLQHSVPCVGFVVREAPVPARMDPAAYVPHIRRTRAPMSVLRDVQAGHDVVLPDGTVLPGLPRRAGRVLALLGDTHDARGIAELAAGADVLVHEATNAHLPGVDPATKPDETAESVEARARSHGHSTPGMAGRFARSIRAKKLVLNHFSARYKGNDDVDPQAALVMDAIKALAQQAFDGEVVCARDFMSFDIELPR